MNQIERLASSAARSMRFASIDPGYAKKGGTAVACWNRGELVAAEFVRVTDGIYDEDRWIQLARDVRAVIMHPEAIVIELPRTYGGRAVGAADANDVIQLAALVGVFVGAFAQDGVRPITISVPKVPKHITENRVKEALSKDEHDLIVAAAPRSLRHNVYDAVGIGLRVLKRKGV